MDPANLTDDGSSGFRRGVTRPHDSAFTEPVKLEQAEIYGIREGASVTAIVTRGVEDSTRQLLQWLTEGLRRPGKSRSGLARALGVAPARITELFKGEYRLRADQLPAVENYLGMKAYRMPRTVPLLGKVGAGAQVYPIDDHEKGACLEEVEAPPSTNASTVALRVVGDSMYPLYEDGDIIFYSQQLPPSEVLNRRAVVKTDDGRFFVKRIRSGSKLGTFLLSSHNAPDVSDVEVEWAAPIDWVRPRF